MPPVEVFGSALADASRKYGDLGQVARLDSFVVADGSARGTRVLRLVNGGGLELEVHPDRALDLGRVTCGGIPFAWLTASGFPANPRSWLAGFGGGLLATCGLDTFGAPSEHDDERFDLHGPIGTQSARVLRAGIADDELIVEGVVRQVRALGVSLELHRRIGIPVGGAVVTVRDTVVNSGSATAGHMILYHCNFGWPLVDEGAVVEIDCGDPRPRDDASAAGLAQWHHVGAPERGFAEQAFLHQGSQGTRSTASIVNEAAGLSVRISHSLPHLFQWKLLAERDYVIGLEPANCATLLGRATAAESGMLPLLEPGEAVSYEVDIAFAAMPGGAPRP